MDVGVLLVFQNYHENISDEQVFTHDLELAGRCDRALLVDGGRVVADGPAADVVHHYRARVAACS